MFPYDGVLPATPLNKLGLEAPNRIPVLVPEDSLSGWHALKRCIATQTDLMFVRCPAGSTEVLTYCCRLMPCILIIDHASLDKLDRQRFMQTVDFGRAVSVLVKVRRDDFQLMERLLRMGCMGFVAEQAAPSVLGHAIRALAKGEIWASRRFLANFVRWLLGSQSSHTLTLREAQILQLIVRKLSNRDIAKELFISRETVRWHIRTLYAKLGVHDRTEAANYAVRLEHDPQLLFGRTQPR